MLKIIPNLWFDGNAEEAAEFYISVFPNSRITNTYRNGDAVVSIDFELDGHAFTGINGGPHFTFNEAVSFAIPCTGQAESDHYWHALTADGGVESQCGWLKDRFGVSWQVYPRELGELLSDPDPDRAARALAAMLQQHRIDTVAIRAAADGPAAEDGPSSDRPGPS